MFPVSSDLPGAACSTLSEEEKRMFFPAEGAGRWAYKKPKEICNACPVIDKCYERIQLLEPPETALDDRYGMWAGLSPRERYRLDKGVA